MHRGEDTDYYLKKGFRVVAIEANPSLCDAALEKFKPFVESGRLEIVNVGAGERRGTLDFYVNKLRTEWSSFHPHISGRKDDMMEVISVEVQPMADIMKEFGAPYYVKIDIEGNDRYALESILGSRYRVPYISVENGSTMLKSFLDTEYVDFKYVQQNNVTSLRHRYPAMEGKYIEYTFQRGASGKFGEELEGEWVAYDKAYELISEVWNVETV